MARNFKELRDKLSPEDRAQVEERVKEAIAAMPLDHLREAQEYTQTQLGQVLQISVEEIAELERTTDVYLGTLTSYIRAMGGNLQIRVAFSEGEIIVDRFRDLQVTPIYSSFERAFEARSAAE